MGNTGRCAGVEEILFTRTAIPEPLLLLVGPHALEATTFEFVFFRRTPPRNFGGDANVVEGDDGVVGE
jgi:hypothetical protein